MLHFMMPNCFLYMIEGAIIQLLSSDNSDVREGRIERVLIHFSQT